MYVPLSTLALAASILSSSGLIEALSASEIPADTPISSLLSSAQAHLSKGQTTDALLYYDAAIARDPSDYLTFFKRATTYLSLGRTSLATEDFNKVLTLRPGFEGAHIQLAKIKSRSADWDGAKQQLVEAQGAAALAEAAAANGNWDECIGHSGEAIQVANRSPNLREVEEGMGDLHHVINMRPGDITPHLKISAITFFSLGDAEQGMAQIKKCLHSDPENKACKKLLKQEKSIEKTLVKVNKALSKNQPMTGVKMLVPQGDDRGLIDEVKEQARQFKETGIIPEKAPNMLLNRVAELACQAYYDLPKMNAKKASTYCKESLDLDENSFYGLLYKAKVQMDADEFEASINLLNQAAEVRPEKKQDIAQVALKRSKTKDYYKVLGVPHDADERQIKSAYRKLSKVHHPDKAIQAGLTKEEAEKKMAGINEAYEVLSNPELRARFDRGDDPNSNEPQGGNPFGGQPFMFQQGGGGQQFNFKFGSGGGGGFGGFPFGG
ncbi:uncharacterized protein PG998_014151 [Apiospora kogelbergensis]|uniref:uncharacterized protein n=1 Tax=Apiospora kogelbergensis TaxID=1337665 RepID=UPI0031301095